MANTTEKECNICGDILGPDVPELDKIFINDVWTCRGCLNNVFRRAIQHEDEYPALMNGEPIDLGEVSAHIEHHLLEQYNQLGPQQAFHPHLRIYCACGTFIGRTATPDLINPLATVGDCPTCKKRACIACTKPLNEKDLNASIIFYGCKEKIEAAEKDHQKLLDGEDRGKGYQVCPTCRRYINLKSACHHMKCPCKKEFSYLCSVVTQEKEKHWGPTLEQCPLYPNVLSLAQTAFIYFNRPNRGRQMTRDLFLEALVRALPRHPYIQVTNKLRAQLMAYIDLATADQTDDDQPGQANPVRYEVLQDDDADDLALLALALPGPHHGPVPRSFLTYLYWITGSITYWVMNWIIRSTTTCLMR
jgi:hypothetical protein